MVKLLLSAGIALGLVLGAGARTASAGLLRMESQSLFSARNSDTQQTELPMYEFFESSYVSDLRDFEMNANFGVFAEPMLPTQDFNLYILDMAYSPVKDRVTVRAGRSFNVRTSIRTTTMDSVGADWQLFEKRVKVGVLAGVERKLLRGSLDSTTDVAGAHASYRSASMFPLFLGTKYMFRNPTVSSFPKQHLASLSAQKPLPGKWSPELLANSELNVGPGRLNLGEAGFDLYPTSRTALRWRALTYDAKSDDDIEEPIFSIFSMGRLYETSAQADYQFNAAFSSSVSMAYDNYLLQPGTRTSGYKLDLDTKFSRKIFTINNTAYFFQSYGGEAYGDRVRLRENLTDRTQLDQVADVTYYEKITSSKRFAVNLESWLGVWLWDRFKLNSGVEFNINNNQWYDFRVAAKLTYLLWKEL